MPAIKLRKIGGSTVVAIPPYALEALALKPGSEVSIEVEDGRVVLAPVAKTAGRIGIAARLAQCDFSIPYTAAEQAEIDMWEYAKPVGREII